MKVYGFLKEVKALWFKATNNKDVQIVPPSAPANDVTLNLPDVTTDLVGTTTTQTLTNKSISGSTNTITNVSLTTGVTGTLPTTNGGTGTSSTATFPASGVIVTETGTQTLTNKTLTSPLGLVKADVGLGNVDNTSDVNKPVSTAQASADSAVQAFSIQRANHTGTQDIDTTTTGTLPILRGGTGQTTANAGLNALLPSQTSNSGKVLKTDGTNASWQTEASSVNLQFRTVPTTSRVIAASSTMQLIDTTQYFADTDATYAFDSGGVFNYDGAAGADKGKAIIPTGGAGKWLISASIIPNNKVWTSTFYTRLVVYVNGTIRASNYQYVINGANSSPILCLTTTFNLADGDKVHIGVVNTSTTQTIDLTTDLNDNWFEMYRVSN